MAPSLAISPIRNSPSPKLSSWTPSSSIDYRKLTFRAQGIPHGLDVEGAKTRLCASLEAQVLSLDSLAASSDGKKEQAATLRLFEKSVGLDGDCTKWLISAACFVGASRKQSAMDTHVEPFTRESAARPCWQ